MTRSELEHVIRAAVDIASDDDIVAGRDKDRAFAHERRGGGTPACLVRSRLRRLLSPGSARQNALVLSFVDWR
jgi:hypothetical protein